MKRYMMTERPIQPGDTVQIKAEVGFNSLYHNGVLILGGVGELRFEVELRKGKIILWGYAPSDD